MEGLIALIVVVVAFVALSRRGRRESSDQLVSPQNRPLSPAASGVSTLRKPRSSVRWIPFGQVIRVAGRAIDGMVYIGSESQRDEWYRHGGSSIDPRLSVASAGTDFGGDSMPYWPTYRDIDRRARATYLNWLAGDRADRRIGAGYVFLYFYGLERRYFIDNPSDEEKRLLIAEVERLLLVYGENASVRRYLSTFLDAAQITLNPRGDSEPSFEQSGYEIPLGQRVAIGRMLKEGKPLTADWLLAWYVAEPTRRLRTPARRAFAEFRALFQLLFEDRYSEGLRQRAPKRLIHVNYSAASSAFQADLSTDLGDVPDISGLSRSLNIADEFVEQATVELDKYSRFLGRNPEGRDTIEAHALLPERLWPLFPSTKMEQLGEWASEIIKRGGLVPVEQVIERLEGVEPTKIAKRQLTGAADALARLSIGMAPDPRFALRSPKLGEPVVLFGLPEGITALEEVSDNYRHVLVAIAIGSFIAHADGTIAAPEHAALLARIDNAELPAPERARLVANLQWLMAVQPDLALFRRRLVDASEEVRQQFGEMALGMAAADGAIDPGEIKAVERLYKSIGLSADGIYSALHALAAGDEPVTVRRAQEQPKGFDIPKPEREATVSLNTDRVAALMADTARASAVLGSIFSDDDLGESDPQEEAADDADTIFIGLEPKHAAFLGELLTRPHWDEPDMATLARQFELMQAGTIETLNEWSFDRFGDTLIEEYEGYELNPEVSAELANLAN